ncbi:hypothetical protein C1646_689256 [Rhizophagus diaphanus]|nr:hypothetical protein C1646_689256 [Rhizophagus diaphanus] [Rhizophagus sp. MUCL 43196]
MSQNYNISSNCQNEGYEPFITGNNYSVGLQQARDVIQEPFLNNQVHYSHCNAVNPPNNCFFTSDDNNLSTQQEDVNVISDHDKQQPLSPHTPHAQLSFTQSSQFYPQISAPKQRLIYNNDVITRQVSNQNPQFSHNGLHDSSTTTNSQMNCTEYTELFKIEISGIEIVVRQKILPRLNQSHWETQQQQQRDEQPSVNLSNRNERSQNHRMHPYNIPNEQNYRTINRNNSNVIFRQQRHQYYSMCQQKNNISEIDRTSVNENTNNINITQNTLVNQSSVYTRQQTNAFEECNNLINQNL